MRRAIAIITVVLASGVVGLGPASASPPLRDRNIVDLTFVNHFYSDLCGFPVATRLVGNLDSKVFFDQSRDVIREVDTQPGATVTFISPYGSFSYPFANALITTYSDGATIGSSAVATATGLAGNIPGIAADAGQMTFSAHVFDFTTGGIPIVAFDGIISLQGHSNDPAAADEAICAALQPSP